MSLGKIAKQERNKVKFHKSFYSNNCNILTNHFWKETQTIFTVISSPPLQYGKNNLHIHNITSIGICYENSISINIPEKTATFIKFIILLSHVLYE